MANDRYRGVEESWAPSVAPFAVVPHDSNALPTVPKSLWVGVGGTIVVRCPGSDSDVTFVNVPNGSVLPVRPSHVRASGTTASFIVGF